MPRVLLFAPCEKVVVDRESNTLSLISLLEEVQYQVPSSDTQLPQNVAIPMKWDIVTLWVREAGDDGIEFEQRVALLDENNQPLIEQTVRWRFGDNDRSHRVAIHIFGMPFSLNRRHFVAAGWLRSIGGEWTEIGTFPIEMHPSNSTPPTAHTPQ